MLRLFIGTLVICTVVAFGAPAASAHSEFRIIGTLTRVQESEIDVKTEESLLVGSTTKDIRTISFKIDKNTKVTRDNKEVKISELKKGRSVVVDAFGDDESDYRALEIRLVPAIPARKSK